MDFIDLRYCFWLIFAAWVTAKCAKFGGPQPKTAHVGHAFASTALGLIGGWFLLLTLEGLDLAFETICARPLNIISYVKVLGPPFFLWFIAYCIEKHKTSTAELDAMEKALKENIARGQRDTVG